MILSFFEKNDVMRVIKEVGFNPEEFWWSDADVYEQSGLFHDMESTLVWKKDPTIYFLFCMGFDYSLRFYPNRRGERNHDYISMPRIRGQKDWNPILEMVKNLWAIPLKKEFDRLWFEGEVKAGKKPEDKIENRFSIMDIK